LLQLA